MVSGWLIAVTFIYERKFHVKLAHIAVAIFLVGVMMSSALKTQQSFTLTPDLHFHREDLTFT